MKILWAGPNFLHPTTKGGQIRTLGILRWRWQLFNQRGIEVLDLEATSLFDLS